MLMWMILFAANTPLQDIYSCSREADALALPSLRDQVFEVVSF
jgi:hypothetical protein